MSMESDDLPPLSEVPVFQVLPSKIDEEIEEEEKLKRLNSKNKLIIEENKEEEDFSTFFSSFSLPKFFTDTLNQIHSLPDNTSSNTSSSTNNNSNLQWINELNIAAEAGLVHGREDEANLRLYCNNEKKMKEIIGINSTKEIQLHIKYNELKKLKKMKEKKLKEEEDDDDENEDENRMNENNEEKKESNDNNNDEESEDDDIDEEFLEKFSEENINEGIKIIKEINQNSTYISSILGWENYYNETSLYSLSKLLIYKVKEYSMKSIYKKSFIYYNNFINKFFLNYFSILTRNNFLSLSYNIYFNYRNIYLFDMILNIPYSIISIKELKDVLILLKNLNKKLYYNNIVLLIKNLKTIIKKRLLNIGVNTNNIINYYINLIKVIRYLLDTSSISNSSSLSTSSLNSYSNSTNNSNDHLLYYVSLPIRSYLKNRKDSIKIIINSLINSVDPTNSDDNSSKEIREALKINNKLLHYNNEENDIKNASTWKPNDLNLEKISNISSTISSNNGKDLLEILVSIYGSADLFINEYKNILGKNLFQYSNNNNNLDNELTNLELLKIRFGEELLHNCEVMLRDIEDSKRVNFSVIDYIKKNLLLNTKNDTNEYKILNQIINKQVEVILISEHYWPSLASLQPGTESVNMKLHPDFLSIISTYNQAYEKVRAPRKLSHLQTLGQVELTITTNDGKQRDVQVTPLQVSIFTSYFLYFFLIIIFFSTLGKYFIFFK